MTAVDENILRLERNFAAPPAAVWALFTRPELIARWFGSSHGFRARDVQVDLRPGGRWSLMNHRGPTVEQVGGTYHEVEPERRLTYSYHFEGTTFFSVVTVALSATDTGTRLDFLQTGFPDRRAWVEHGRGWPGALQVMIDGLLLALRADRLMHGPARLDGVAADLEAARARFEAEGKAVQPTLDPP